MNNQDKAAVKLDEFLVKFNSSTDFPDKENTELCIKEILSCLNDLCAKADTGVPTCDIIESLGHLWELVCDFSNIFEYKFPQPTVALKLRNIELKIAKLYREFGGTSPLRELWEIHIVISEHFSTLNLYKKSLRSAQTALKLFKQSNSAEDLHSLSHIYIRIAFACQDSDPERAIDLFAKSSALCMKSDTYDGYLDAAVSNINMAMIMCRINKPNDAVGILRETAILLDSINARYDSRRELVDIQSAFYGVSASAQLAQKNPEVAIRAAEKGITLCGDLGGSIGTDLCKTADLLYTEISLALKMQEKYIEAIEIQYKLLSIWSRQPKSLVRSCHISEIYIEISSIYSKHLGESKLAAEFARLALKETDLYFSQQTNTFDSDAVLTRMRCLANLADIYHTAKMYNSAAAAYKSVLLLLNKELTKDIERISTICLYAYALYGLGRLENENGNRPEAREYLTHALKSIDKFKKSSKSCEALRCQISDYLDKIKEY